MARYWKLHIEEGNPLIGSAAWMLGQEGGRTEFPVGGVDAADVNLVRDWVRGNLWSPLEVAGRTYELPPRWHPSRVRLIEREYRQAALYERPTKFGTGALPETADAAAGIDDLRGLKDAVSAGPGPQKTVYHTVSTVQGPTIGHGGYVDHRKPTGGQVIRTFDSVEAALEHARQAAARGTEFVNDGSCSLVGGSWWPYGKQSLPEVEINSIEVKAERTTVLADRTIGPINRIRALKQRPDSFAGLAR